MLGEQEATVDSLRRFELHGVTYADLTLTLADGSSLTARLGPEAVPEDLAAGERVLAMVAAGIVISIRRAPTG